MRIRRNRSRLFRGRQRGFNWLSVFVLLSLLLGVFSVSRDRLGQWLGINSSENSTILEKATKAYANGDLSTTIDLARQLLENEPDNIDAIALLARALVHRSYSDYYRTIDRKSALDLTQNVLNKNPNNLDLLGIHAFVLQANGKSEEAYHTAVYVIENNPDHIPARVALALAYGGRGIFEASLREGKRALELAQQYQSDWQADAQRAIAIAYGDLGEYEKAIQAIDRAIDLNSDLHTLHFEHALYSLQTNNYHDATVSYYRALALDDDNVKARLRLCELSSMLRETKTALEFCIEVTEMAPTWVDGWYQLGREYFLQGEFALAQDALNRCTSLQMMQNTPVEERRFECWYIQGQAAEILGDCEALVELYAEFSTIATDPNVLVTWTYPPEGPSRCSVHPIESQTTQ